MKKLMLINNNSLKKNGYNDNSINSYQYDLKITASRVFSAFPSNKYVGLNIERIRIDVYKDGNFVAKNIYKVLNLQCATRPAIICGHNRGLIGNLKTLFKIILQIRNWKMN